MGRTGLGRRVQLRHETEDPQTLELIEVRCHFVEEVLSGGEKKKTPPRVGMTGISVIEGTWKENTGLFLYLEKAPFRCRERGQTKFQTEDDQVLELLLGDDSRKGREDVFFVGDGRFDLEVADLAGR